MSYIGADFVADALASLGVEHVFAIVSIHNMPLLDAINRLGKTKIIDVRKNFKGKNETCRLQCKKMKFKNIYFYAKN